MNGLIALILCYFAEFDSFEADYVTVVEDRPILSAEYRLPMLAKTDPSDTLQRGLSVIAEPLVQLTVDTQPNQMLSLSRFV